MHPNYLSRALAIPAVLSCFLIGAVRAEQWTTTKGETFEGQLSGVFGPLAIFAEPRGSRQVVVEALDDAGLARVADHIAARSAPTEWRASTSAVAKALRGRLQAQRNRQILTYEPPAGVPEPEMYVIYFGASWSEASAEFNPELTARYRALKKSAGAKFELIYVGREQKAEQHEYWVAVSEMPWPTVKFAERGKLKLLDRWDVGVPSLIVVNAEGEVIIHSERANRAPVTPSQVLTEFGVLLTMMADESTAGKRAKHRLAVLQHVRAHPAGEQRPRPYVLVFDRSRYQTLELTRLVARLELDEKGRVTDASFAPSPGAVHAEQLGRDALGWLFLPAVSNGVARATTVELPIEL